MLSSHALRYSPTVMFDGSISVPASAAVSSRDSSFCASLKVPLKVTERERRLPLTRSKVKADFEAVRASATDAPHFTGSAGSFLLFKKGDWTIREEEVSDLEMIANPFEIYYGFQYWRDQTPGEVQMVRIDQLHLRPRRAGSRRDRSGQVGDGRRRRPKGSLGADGSHDPEAPR